MFSISLGPVILASVAAFVVGFLLHGPVLGKLWMKLANVVPTGNEKMGDMVPQMLWNLLANFVTAFVLAVIYSLASSSVYLASGLWGGVTIATLIWAGFIVTGSSMDVIWMKSSKGLWLFECMCSLIMLVVMGVIIACL
jgi:hypothetical protein